ncbi:hypothetical protein ACOMHN_047996 [Nucella lapillus]
MQLSLTILVVLVAALGEAYYNNPLTAGYADPLYGGYGAAAAYGGGYPGALGVPGAYGSIGLGQFAVVGSSHHAKEEKMKLTCQTFGLGVTIEERPMESHHHGGAGLGYGAFSPMFGKSASSRRGVNASLDILLPQGINDNVYVLVTDHGHQEPDGSCPRANFGMGVSAKKKKGGAMLGLGGIGAAYNPFGAVGYNAGLGAISPYGGAFGVGLAPAIHIGKKSGRKTAMQAEGVIYTIHDPSRTRQTVQIQNLGKFQKVEELAGKSVMVCPEMTMGKDGKALCTRDGISCCTLGFDSAYRPALMPEDY